MFTREAQIDRLESEAQPWDIVVIGGGASGVGVAVDAAARGYRVALLEQHDFGKGTSSRSTKLVHGGLRYLQQGRIRLVRDALIERGLLCRNAPHLVHPLPTIVPLHSRWEGVYYGIGLKVYERLSGRLSLGPSRRLSIEEMRVAIPTLETRGLHGGVRYLDGAFDDTRLLVNLVHTAIEHGAVCVNYAPVRELVKEADRVRGVVAEDLESGKSLRLSARVVVNATGPFSDHILKLDNSGAASVIAASQGIHLVFDRAFLPGDSALIVPKTRDGRVIFAVPWHNHAVVGTTDTPRADLPLEPRALPGEVDFLLETIAPYLSRKPQHGDIRSIFAGIRPLVRGGDASNTSKLGRDHQVRISSTGLVSLLGGKWTTYRKMAEDCVDHAARIAELEKRPCSTKSLSIHGHPGNARIDRFCDYGSDAAALEELISTVPHGGETLAERLPYVAGQAIFAARHEMARTVEDVLARRTRALFLDAEAALAAAPRVAELLAGELHRDAKWQADQLEQFRCVAGGVSSAILRPLSKETRFMQAIFAEFLGTALLILLGNGVVANVVLPKTKGSGSGWIVITFGWGMAVFVAVWCVGPISGAHINPAVTLALAVTGRFAWSLVASYVAAQLLGAIVGSVIVFLFYFDHFRESNDPNAKLATFATAPAIRNIVSNLFSEAVGTCVLVLAVLMAVDPSIQLSGGPTTSAESKMTIGLGTLGALPVGLLVLAIGLSLGGTTGYAINPARDLGPRIAHQLLPIPGKRDSDWGYALIPVVGPLVGAVIAHQIYSFLWRLSLSL